MHPEENEPQIEHGRKPESERFALRLSDCLEFVEFDPSLGRLTYFHTLGVTRQVSLGFSEALLLEYFLKKPGEIINRQQLLDYAWGDRVVSQGSLNQAISNLRSLLADDQLREIIITVPRHGYQLNPESLVSWQDWLLRRAEIIASPEVSVEVDSNSDSVNPEIPRFVFWRLPVLRGIVLSLLIFLVVGVFFRFYYMVWPPYAVENIESNNLKLTLIGKDLEDLNGARDLLMPLIKRMETLGGGIVLVNRENSYLEVNCMHKGGSVYTIYLDAGHIKTIEDSYLLKCLK